MNLPSSAVQAKENDQGAARGMKPLLLILEMRDAAFRPIIRTLADALDKIDQKGLKPIGSLRGGTTRIMDWGTSAGALAWIAGETGQNLFRVAIPISTWFSGRDETGPREFPITMFDGAEITMNGTVRLAGNVRLTRVQFTNPPITFVLPDVQKRIAKHIGEFLNLRGHDLPTTYIDYVRLGQVNSTDLRPVINFVRSHWQRDMRNEAPPSPETIYKTLQALRMRPRLRSKPL